jgi:hypothetical protein
VGSNNVVNVPPPEPPYRYLDLADQPTIKLLNMFPAAAGTSGTSIGPSMALGMVGRQQQSWQNGPGGEYENQVAISGSGHDVPKNMLVKGVEFDNLLPQEQRLWLKDAAYANII